MAILSSKSWVRKLVNGQANSQEMTHFVTFPTFCYTVGMFLLVLQLRIMVRVNLHGKTDKRKD